MSETDSITFTCFHCGNDTRHVLVMTHTATHLYEQIYGQRYHEPFDYFVHSCGTCNGLTVLGGFQHELHGEPSGYPRLFPTGPTVVPRPSMLGTKHPIPSKVIRVYEDAWSLRRKNPNAFANQIRRALEYICEDQNAQGSNLFHKLQDLANRSVFPATLTDLATQIRLVGNLGSHAGDEDVDIWDAELIDELFRMILEYVYVTPSKLERLKQRLKRTVN